MSVPYTNNRKESQNALDDTIIKQQKVLLYSVMKVYETVAFDDYILK